MFEMCPSRSLRLEHSYLVLIHPHLVEEKPAHVGLLVIVIVQQSLRLDHGNRLRLFCNQLPFHHHLVFCSYHLPKPLIEVRYIQLLEDETH